MKIIFKKERKPYRLRTDFLDCTNYRNMHVACRDSDIYATYLGAYNRSVLINYLKEKFESIVFFEIEDEELSLGFIFDDKAEEAFFLLMTSEGIDL